MRVGKYLLNLTVIDPQWKPCDRWKFCFKDICGYDHVLKLQISLAPGVAGLGSRKPILCLYTKLDYLDTQFTYSLAVLMSNSG